MDALPITVGPGGARAMVEAGALEDVDAVFALHIGPTLDAGQLALI